MKKQYILDRIKEFMTDDVSQFDLDDRVDTINEIKKIFTSVDNCCIKLRAPSLFPASEIFIAWGQIFRV